MSEPHEPDSTHVSSEPIDRATSRGWLGGLGVVLVLAGLSALGGLVGLLGGVVLVGCWYALETPLVVALGQLAVAALAPTTGLVPWLVVAELGLFLVLVEPGFDQDDASRATVELAIALGVLLASAWVVSGTTSDLWVVSATVCAVGALGLYGVHRYERAQLYVRGVVSS